MINARYKWEIGTLTKGFAIHRKSLPATKYVPIIAIIFICWGAYDAVTSDHWIAGAPLLFLGALLLFGARLWRSGNSAARFVVHRVTDRT